MPGLAALNKGGAVLDSEVSCAPAAGCAAGGDYQDRRGHGVFQGFVVSQGGEDRHEGGAGPADLRWVGGAALGVDAGDVGGTTAALAAALAREAESPGQRG